MGVSASTSVEKVSEEQREAEALAASTGALPMLQKAFTLLSDPESKLIPLPSLERCYYLDFESQMRDGSTALTLLRGFLNQLPASIVDVFFLAEEGGVSWLEFLRGYIKCCARTAASISCNNLFRVYATAVAKSGVPEKLQFGSDDDQDKISGSLMPSDVLVLLWTCWLMSWDCRNWKSPRHKTDNFLPDMNHLVLSAVLSCAEVSNDLNVWELDISGLDIQLPAKKIHMWSLRTVPNLADCFVHFFHSRVCDSITHEDKEESSSAPIHEISLVTNSTHLVTHGRAWAVSLTLRSTAISEAILRACSPDGTNKSLIYRSSVHGKGLNRFWSNVEGYNGPLLVLVAAGTRKDHDGDVNMKCWIIGALIYQGLENRDTFYGSMGSLYAISPVFHVFLPSGKERSFVYSHLHPTGRVYQPHPKPVGIAFGGSIGNERIFIDEDFSRVTVRHHAVDKTYQAGPLFPNQGFLPFEASITEVEVWGLGDRAARDSQMSYKKREELFTEQRRKVDLKTFASWDDSPEKMMMDMISDPNAVRREDR